MKVGDWVMAIGNPFGLGGSVTVGIISAKQRDINSGPYDDYLQTDAAINKGNSGGPLFNMDGEVIGVNTAIISPTGGSIGIGFAVPSDAAVVVIDQLRQFGETRRGWLGVKIQSHHRRHGRDLGVKENTGALVSSVTPDGPAAKAGIQDGDVILKFDGKDVTTMRGLPRLVAQTPIGKEVDVEVLRKGQSADRQGGRRPARRGGQARAKPGVKDAPKSQGQGQGQGARTAAVQPQAARAQLADRPGARPAHRRAAHQARPRHATRKGVVVLEVDPASPAAEKRRQGRRRDRRGGAGGGHLPRRHRKGIDKVQQGRPQAVLLRLEDAKGDMRFVAVPVQ